MAINERLIDTAVSGCSAEPTKEGLILHLDANDVDSYDGDGDEWIDITDHEYTPTTNVSEHFNTVTFSAGTSGTEVINDVGFQPDLVWLKATNQAWFHRVFDSLRGVGQPLHTDTDYAQGFNTDITLASFDTEGFTFNNFNTASNQVAWCFKAGGAAVSNTDGTITSQVSANNDLGFSIVEFNSGTTHPYTTGHGLDSKPEMIISKVTNTPASWTVFHKDFSDPDQSYMYLDSQASVVDYGSSLWNYSNWGTDKIGGTQLYGSNNTVISYCFASKRGVSKVGSYKGNGWTTGASNKIYTGFEPAFIIGKCTSNSPSNWWIFDNKRGDEVLYPNLSDDKDLLSDYVSFDRDGFTLSDAPFVNQNGRDYIYYAVAKNTNETSLIPTKDDFTTGSVETTDLELDLDANSYSGSGDWLDGTSNDNDGTITGASYVNDGSVDYFSFDGSNDYIDCGSASSIIPAGSNFTIETWVNANNDTTNTYWSVVNAVQSGTPYGGFQISNEYSTDNWAIALNKSGTWTSLDSGVGIEVGKWVHLAFTYDGSYMKLFVDGEERFSSSQSGSLQYAGNVNLYLGRNLNVYSPIKVGQVRVYSSALTPAQIESNYEATKIYNTPDLKLNLDAASFPEKGESGYDNTPSTWTDSSGNSNNGTILGGATFDSELGNWLDFDGSNDEVSLNSGNTISASTFNNCTFEYWIKLDNLLETRHLYFHDYTSNNVNLIGLSRSNTNNKLMVFGSTGHINIARGNTDLVANKWTHIAVTLTYSQLKIYIDGELDATVSQSFNGFSSPLYGTIGNDRGNQSTTGSRWLNGQVGQFRLYSSALTQAQIRQNYNFTKPNYPNGYDGVLGGGTTANKPTWNSGGYFTFDGSNDYVTNNDLSLDTSKQFSFCGWVYPTADLTWQRMFSWGTSSTEVTVQKRGDNNKARFISRVSNSIKFDVDGAVLTNNQWHFIAVTGDGSDVKMYVNNNAAVTDNIAGTNNYNNLQLGTGAGTTENFDGRISKFKLYDKVLTQTEIDNLYCEGE